jgi:hypothetical protein
MVLGAALVAPFAQAAAPARGLPYSGRLELDGAPVSGSVPMVFRLYDAPSAGNLLFTQAESVQVVGGSFAVVLGTVAGHPLPESLYTAGTLHLEISVNGMPLAGRQQIYAAAQSVRAAQADNFTVSSTLNAATVQATNVAATSVAATYVTTTSLAVANIDAAGRMHISNQSDDIYLLARGGQVRVSNAWGGHGSLTADGTVTAGAVNTGAVNAASVTTTGEIRSHSGQTPRCMLVVDQCAGEFNGMCPVGMFVTQVRNWAGNRWQVQCCFPGR